MIPARYRAPMLKPTLVRLDERDRELLELEAQRLGVSHAAVLRMLVREYLPATPKQVRR